MPGKELKKRAKMVLGEHYLLFVAVCLIAAFLGTEFSLSLNAVTLYTEDFSVPANPSVVTHFLTRKNILEVVTELATGDREERDRISDEIIQDAIGYTQTGPAGPGGPAGSPGHYHQFCIFRFFSCDDPDGSELYSWLFQRWADSADYRVCLWNGCCMVLSK